MTPQQILSGNKTIAIYDGWTTRNPQPVNGRDLYENATHTQWLDSFTYHSDWNKLIPVYSKAYTELKEMFTTGPLIFDLSSDFKEPILESTLSNDIGNAFEFLVKLIELINQHKQKPTNIMEQQPVAPAEPAWYEGKKPQDMPTYIAYSKGGRDLLGVIVKCGSDHFGRGADWSVDSEGNVTEYGRIPISHFSPATEEDYKDYESQLPTEYLQTTHIKNRFTEQA